MEQTPFFDCSNAKGCSCGYFCNRGHGAFNAALEAVAILAAGDESLTEALYEFRRSQRKKCSLYAQQDS